MSCNHRNHFIESRGERMVVRRESCRAEPVGQRIEVVLPFFPLERADVAHMLRDLS